jgi:hypothetical protein
MILGQIVPGYRSPNVMRGLKRRRQKYLNA